MDLSAKGTLRGGTLIYHLEQQYPTVLVFVAGPNCGQMGRGPSSTMRRTFNKYMEQVFVCGCLRAKEIVRGKACRGGLRAHLRKLLEKMTKLLALLGRSFGIAGIAPFCKQARPPAAAGVNARCPMPRKACPRRACPPGRALAICTRLSKHTQTHANTCLSVLCIHAPTPTHTCVHTSTHKHTQHTHR